MHATLNLAALEPLLPALTGLLRKVGNSLRADPKSNGHVLSIVADRVEIHIETESASLLCSKNFEVLFLA